MSHRPWTEVLQVVAEESPDLLVVADDQLSQLQTTAGAALRNPPCDMILARGPFPAKPANVLFALRGGPYAELALRLGLAIGGTTSARLTALHFSPAGQENRTEAAFKGVERVLRNLPEVHRVYVAADEPRGASWKPPASRTCSFLARPLSRLMPPSRLVPSQMPS